MSLVVPTTATLPLVGPAGEPVDLFRTLMSHGVADLPPGRVDEEARAYETTLRIAGSSPRTVRIVAGKARSASISVRGPHTGARTINAVTDGVRRILNLDEDLSGFYAVAREDPELVWATRGAGRMLRPETLLEAVIKTICTTNCAWSATVRMVTALVDSLGQPSAGGHGRAFPTADAMAAQPESFYREVVRAGYRATYLRKLAIGVVEGEFRLDELADASRGELPDDEIEKRLRTLPGIGPYGAAHVMMLLGRHSRLILDSWTRPKYARLVGKSASDAQIMRRFSRYGEFAGLAFWLFLTRDWVGD